MVAQRNERNELDPYITVAFVVRAPVSGVEELKNAVGSCKGDVVYQRSSPKKLFIVEEENENGNQGKG